MIVVTEDSKTTIEVGIEGARPKDLKTQVIVNKDVNSIEEINCKPRSNLRPTNKIKNEKTRLRTDGIDMDQTCTPIVRGRMTRRERGVGGRDGGKILSVVAPERNLKYFKH